MSQSDSIRVDSVDAVATPSHHIHRKQLFTSHGCTHFWLRISLGMPLLLDIMRGRLTRRQAVKHFLFWVQQTLRVEMCNWKISFGGFEFYFFYKLF